MSNRPQFILCMLAVSLLLTSGLSAQTGKRFLISEAGAVGDGKTVNTKPIQALIDSISASGGGTLVVSGGDYMSGALFFKPGVNLLVEKDGILHGTANPDDYPQINTRWEGTERLWTSAFLNFDHMDHVQVSGDGLIDGSGERWPGAGRRGRGPATQPGEQARGRGPATQFGGRGAGTRPAMGRGRPRMICFSNCNDVHISDLHLRNQAVWCLHVLYSQNVVIENLNIRATLYIPSSDGMDIDSSKDVQISRCDIACYDDDIAIKCGKDADGLRVNRPSENITISDCTIGIGGGICMGSEISGSIRHVLVQRCTFNGTDQCARFKSQPSRGGVVEDIIFKDITLNNPREAFDMNLAWRMVGPALPAANPLSLVHDIHLINFSGTAQSAGIIQGLKDGPIRDVQIENCNIAVQRGLRIMNAENIDTAGLHLTVAQGDPIIRGMPATRPAGQVQQ